jgi:nucleoside-diphosphate-sugar epimerase
VRIMVAGGAGYVGSVLVPMLTTRGDYVHVVDLCWFGNHLPPDVTVDQRELFDLRSDELRGFDRVVFLAGLSNDPMAEDDPAANWRYNAALPAYLAYQAKQAGVKRFVYASTCSIYGYLPSGKDREPSHELTAPSCSYPYGLSKLQGERGCFQLQGDGFSVVALRKGTISGHSPRMRFDLIVNTMFRSAATSDRIKVDRPDLWRPILDIRSAAAAYVAAIDAPAEVSGAFNIADGNYHVGEVAERVADTLGCVAVDVVADDIAKRSASQAALRSYCVDCSEAQRVLGWRPMADPIRQIVASMFGQNYGDMHRDEYSNIATWRKVRR